MAGAEVALIQLCQLHLARHQLLQVPSRSKVFDVICKLLYSSK